MLDEGFSLATEVDALWASTFGRWHTYGVACLSALAGAAHRNSFGIWLTDPRATKRAENPSGSVGAATGVGRRFLIELESGKPSCQLGRSLLVAGALGLKPADILASDPLTHQTDAELPDLTEEEVQEPNGQSSRLL